MPRLRQNIRRTKTSGAKIYATVEEVNMGLATVRIGGQRLTNLPVHGVLPSLGDTVVVDYSGEGRPYVRRATVPVDTLSEELEAAAWEQDLPPTEVLPDESVEGPYLPFSAMKMSMSGPYPMAIHTDWHNSSLYSIPFDTLDYDVGNISRMDPYYYNLLWRHNYGVEAPGKYLVRYCIGFPSFDNGYVRGAEVTCRATVFRKNSVGGYWVCGRRWYSHYGTAPVVLSGTAIVPLYHSDERLCTTFTIYPSFYSAVPSTWKDTLYVTMPYEKGKYPILEAYKIADVNPAMLGERNWAQP